MLSCQVDKKEVHWDELELKRDTDAAVVEDKGERVVQTTD